MIPARIHSVRENAETKQSVVTLQDEAGRRVVLIWVGRLEGLSIAMALTGMEAQRPMSAHLMANLLQLTGVQLEQVRIEELKDDIFYAVMKVRNGNTSQELDARPSDALALAALMDDSIPIYIAEDVMESCGIPIPEGKTLRTGNADLAAARAAVQKKMEEIYSAYSTSEAAAEREKNFKQAQQSIIDFLTEEQG